MSSCFALRGFSWSRRVVTPGQTNVASFRFAPTEAPNTKTYEWILVGLPYTGDPDDGDAAFLKIGKPRRWDVESELGPSQGLVADGSLESSIMSAVGCDYHGIGPAEMTEINWTALRTPTEVNSHNAVRKTVLTKLGIKWPASGAVESPSTADVVFITGLWADVNHDAVPADHEIACTGSAFSSLTAVPAAR